MGIIRWHMTDVPIPTQDPSHDILRSRQPLDSILRPKTVAIIGATDRRGSVGRTILENLLRGPFGHSTYPVNPRHDEILGAHCYPTIGDVPRAVELAVVVTPAVTVPGVVRECVAAGVRGAVIISAGFKETGTEGARLETKILDEARRGQLRLIGPN